MDDSTTYISSALDILSDDAVQRDEDGSLIKVISDNSKVKSIVEELFIELEIEEKLGKWARVVAKYGDFFLKVEANPEVGIHSVVDTVYPGSIERKELDGKLLAFSEALSSGSQNNGIYPPWEFIHFRHKGDIYRSQGSKHQGRLGKEFTKYDLTAAYGQSILRPAIQVYAQLRFVENLIILSRLTNSIRRNIFLINTGEIDPDKSYETLQNYAQLLKKDISFDVASERYTSQKHTVSYDEDIFIPVSDTQNDIRIESVGGDVNIKEQYDLEYLLNKLFSALKIPKAYLNYEQDLNARATLIQLDIRYARSVSQLQTTLIGGLMRLAKIQLAYRGINPDDVDLDIQLTSVSSIDQESRLEQKKVSIDAARSMWDMVVTMNDKISGNSGMPMGIGMGDPNPTNQDNALDLKYVSEHILTHYFELGKEDINKILKKPVEENQSQESAKSRRLFDRKKYPNADIHEMYPVTANIQNYERIRESLTKDPQEATEDKLLN